MLVIWIHAARGGRFGHEAKANCPVVSVKLRTFGKGLSVNEVVPPLLRRRGRRGNAISRDVPSAPATALFVCVGEVQHRRVGEAVWGDGRAGGGGGFAWAGYRGERRRSRDGR